jgi:hypothetical protein
MLQRNGEDAEIAGRQKAVLQCGHSRDSKQESKQQGGKAAAVSEQSFRAVFPCEANFLQQQQQQHVYS